MKKPRTRISTPHAYAFRRLPVNRFGVRGALPEERSELCQNQCFAGDDKEFCDGTTKCHARELETNAALVAPMGPHRIFMRGRGGR
jgi:hypothetical protein